MKTTFEIDLIGNYFFDIFRKRNIMITVVTEPIPVILVSVVSPETQKQEKR